MSTTERLHALDAVRAFALLLGVVFHAGLSFTPGMPPGLWAINDTSPSQAIGTMVFASHIFRMSLFFFVAGFFAHLTFHRRGARGFWTDRFTRILVPLVVGWIVLAPTLGAIWVWGLTKTFGRELPAPPANMPPPPAGAFPLTHLWFLYYLLVLYVLVIAIRSTVVALDRSGAIRRAADAGVAWLVRSRAAVAVLPLPLIVAFHATPTWQMGGGIPTPDQSLIPRVISLVAYGTAITFGWLIHRQIDLLHQWARQWIGHLVAAVAATAVCLSLVGPSPVVAEPGAARLIGAVCYGLAIWCWGFAFIGLAIRFLSRPNATIRYVADASYWIYLVHLPVVVAFQVLVGHLPWHWSLKFPLVLVATFAILFVSYRYLVRSTFIGQVLNGRTYPRGSGGGSNGTGNGRGAGASGEIGATAPAEATRDERRSETDGPAGTSGLELQQVVASLDDVHKRYGATVALDGLDLDVRRGELLAVLGPNGAGKSTAIALWLGLIEQDQGSASLFGGSPTDVDTRRHVGVMMQDVGLTPELRVRELISLTASYYPDPLTVEETLALTRLDALADRPYAKLSGGQKRQAQFAVAVCGRPRLLFLDEPTVGLDLEARETMWRTLRALIAQGCSIVLTTHHLEEAEALADRVAVLASGRLIASGTVAEVRSIVSRKHITCTSTLTIDEIRSWPDVVAITRDAGRLRITVVDAEDVVRRLLAADADVRDLEVRQAGLAEAFTELTKEAA